MNSFGSFQVANTTVGCKKTFVIAEIGQNHQGDIDVAKKMIVAAKSIGADCVKFQKSCLHEKFTASALNRSYNSENSWGRTYGEHKTYLEFTIEQYKALQEFASELDIIFTASAMDIQSLQDLNNLNVPVIKIGSGDANNVPLLTTAAQFSTPLFISTGMQSEQMVEQIVEIMQSNGKENYCLLHCVSSYPTEPKDVCLAMIDNYRKKFPGICVGYSGHEQGIAISLAAVLLGAKVIERHFTLDKQQKGTDHKLSLEPAEFRQLISHIRLVENIASNVIRNDQTILNALSALLTTNELEDVKLSMRAVEKKTVLECEMDCRMKLGKSLVYRNNLKSGTMLTEDDICAKVSEPFGISAERFNEFVGHILLKDVVLDDNLDETHLSMLANNCFQ